VGDNVLTALVNLKPQRAVFRFVPLAAACANYHVEIGKKRV